MPKYDRAEELHEIAAELDGVIRGHRDILNREPRILNPLREAVAAAKTKYDDIERDNRLNRD